MGLSVNTIRLIGISTSVVLAAGTYFFFLSPSISTIQENNESFTELQAETINKEGQLANLKEVSNDIETYNEELSEMRQKLPLTADYESASRSISNALNSGTEMVSFKFGNESQIAPIQIPEQDFESGYQALPEFNFEGNTAAPTTDENNNEEGALIRIPIIIEVKSDNYDRFSDYVNSLENQDRLVNVISVDSSYQSTDEQISATVYAFAYISK